MGLDLDPQSDLESPDTPVPRKSSDFRGKPVGTDRDPETLQSGGQSAMWELTWPRR